MFDALIKCETKTESISLRGNRLDDDCMEKIGHFIRMANSVEDLDLRTNVITDRGIKLISQYIVGNQILKSFLVGGNKDITNVSVPYFIDMTKSTNIIDVYTSLASITKMHNVIPYLAENNLRNGCCGITYVNK